MEGILEETYEHKDRVFKIKVTEGEDGLHLHTIDEVTKNVVDCGTCAHEGCSQIRNQKFSRESAEGIIEVIKNILSAWIDRGLV